ncbi:MAG: transcriptional repressor [Endomicrobiales bacterium]|jgi:Fe2+ or Zn2+ uptake regulation protein
MITKRNTHCEQLSDQLQWYHIKPTYQRLKILEYLAAKRIHPTAGHIYRDLVKHIPTMSKTTVYNTLKSFVGKGIVAPVMIAGTETRFEYARKPHPHFFCENCCSIMDIDIDCPPVLKKTVAGHTIKEQHSYFKGICASCRKKESEYAKV